MKQNRLKSIFLILLFSVSALLGCEKEQTVEQDLLDVRLDIPSSVYVPSDTRILTLDVLEGKAPETTDMMLFQCQDGRLWPCRIVETSSQSASILIQDKIVAGDYKIFIKRGNLRKQLTLESVRVLFVGNVDFTPDEGVTVYGQVVCGDKPLDRVVVSDGVEVTQTDNNGFYQLRSKKERGCVFVSVPSGYDPVCKGILPQIHLMFKEAPDVCERADFQFKEAGDQTNYKLLVLGDMHLAKRTNDLNQFKIFADDVNAYLNKHKNEKVYALTLGDMTWDLYWYSQEFSFPEYLDVMNSYFQDLCVYHTMGNHDNDYLAKYDLMAEKPYIRHIAPPYYSFNIGKVHYVVLDNIDCSRYDGTTSRDYFVSVSERQLEWLKKDLAYVSRDTPIILSTHAPVTYPSSSSSSSVTRYNYDGASRLFEILDGYKVDILTGHTHKVFNVNENSLRTLTGKKGFFEHNSGAICAAWWWSGYLSPGINISVDGAHGGYAIWDISGKNYEWIYKASGKNVTHQFHSYDLNEVKKTITMSLGGNKPKFEKFVDNVQEYPTNGVLLNIWNYDPSWTVTVSENGRQLSVKSRFDYDPLHILTMTAKRFVTNDNPYFQTSWSDHFFLVQPSSSNSTLQIEVKDSFGNVFRETMTRPKPFTEQTYRNQP